MADERLTSSDRVVKQRQALPVSAGLEWSQRANRTLDEREDVELGLVQYFVDERKTSTASEYERKFAQVYSYRSNLSGRERKIYEDLIKRADSRARAIPEGQLNASVIYVDR